MKTINSYFRIERFNKRKSREEYIECQIDKTDFEYFDNFWWPRAIVHWDTQSTCFDRMLHFDCKTKKDLMKKISKEAKRLNAKISWRHTKRKTLTPF